MQEWLDWYTFKKCSPSREFASAKKDIELTLKDKNLLQEIYMIIASTPKYLISIKS